MSHFPVCLGPCGSIIDVPHLTVVVSLVLGLGPTKGQGGRVP